MKVLILKPRLDLPFKKLGLGVTNTNLPDIRKPWEEFVNNLKRHHVQNGDKVIVVEAPRWQFNKSLIEAYNPDRAYVPHVEEHNFEGGPKCFYYMQTVIPWLFTVDGQGWAGGGSYLKNANYDDIEYDDGKTFDFYQNRAKSGDSKFDQPKNTSFDLDEPFVFCPLQLPHDETIKWHSPVSVEHFVDRMCEWSYRSGIKVVFKGHPINKASMEPIKRIIKHRAIYVEDVSIHEIMPKASAVYVINSGTGMEAMLHEVPVVRFGYADYNNAVVRGHLDNMEFMDKAYKEATTQDREDMIYTYKKFYNWFVNKICVTAHDIATYKKVDRLS